MSEELKPCPFCGGEPYTDEAIEGGYVVACRDCECRTAISTMDTATRLWNTRAERKPAYVDAPFAIGDLVEKREPDGYDRIYEVVRETAKHMDLLCVRGNMEGFTIKRGKGTLARDWKAAGE